MLFDKNLKFHYFNFTIGFFLGAKDLTESPQTNSMRYHKTFFEFNWEPVICDFSQIIQFIITQVPGKHVISFKFQWIILKHQKL
jgi:hypothetical protein